MTNLMVQLKWQDLQNDYDRISAILQTICLILLFLGFPCGQNEALCEEVSSAEVVINNTKLVVILLHPTDKIKT